MTSSNDTPTDNRANSGLAGKPRAIRRKRKSLSAQAADRAAPVLVSRVSPASGVSLKPGIGARADVGSASGVGSTSGWTPDNDNGNDTAILRRDGDDPAIVIGLAMRYVRLGRDVPFSIVNALFRHAKAGDGAARATVELLRRRIEHRQRKKFERYIAMGLRSPVLSGPHGVVVGPEGSGKHSAVGSGGRDDARHLSLVAIHGEKRIGEAG